MKEARMRSLPLAVVLVASAGSVFAQTQPPISNEERGDLFMARKMYRDAIDVYAKAPQDNAVIWNKAGIAWHQLGQLDRAKADYERALKLKPTYAEAQNNIGAVYFAQKSYRRAIAAYKKALLITPQSASFHKNLGTAYFARKLEKEAMAEYQEAYRLDPETFENRSLTGTVLENGSIEDRARYHYALAKLYAQDSRTDMAIQYLRKALEEGFHDKKKLEQDPEFQAMRDLPEFQELLASEPRVL